MHQCPCGEWGSRRPEKCQWPDSSRHCTNPGFPRVCPVSLEPPELSSEPFL
uniref:Alternative protein ANKRD10 n=1 Tax=Homo sapiens TaxID=9606 RepID=L8EAX8_HUMAN|nr:alternative protein ANKRD10 [Homo sapiens]